MHAEAKFWADVDKLSDPNGCWLWNGATSTSGYGRSRWCGLERVEQAAHRIAWVITRGDVPDGLVLDHTCRVKRCVNPDHLEPVTNRENIRRGWAAAPEPVEPPLTAPAGRRRDYGSGSVRQVGSDRWLLRVAAGTDAATGKRRVVTMTFRGSAKQARLKLAELVARHGRHGREGTGATLARLIDAWLESTTHARATRQNYERAIARIPAKLMETPAHKIGVHDLDRLYQSIDKTHGPFATHQLHAVISGAYTNAMRLRWVTEHPAKSARIPSLPKRPSSTPTVDEARRIIAAGADLEQRLWLRLALVLGRRRSEILALRWSDIDLDAGVVHVERALELDRTVKATKTGDQPDLAIDPATAAAIRTWQNAQRERALAAGTPLVSDPWLFSQLPDSSQPWRPDLATRRWSKTRARAGVRPSIRLQDFRKANTTTLIAGGADVRTVAGRSGHDPSMALGIYAGLVDEANRRAAAIIAHAVDGCVPG